MTLLTPAIAGVEIHAYYVARRVFSLNLPIVIISDIRREVGLHVYEVAQHAHGVFGISIGYYWIIVAVGKLILDL